MLFFFRNSRYATPLRLLVGVAILVFGILEHSRVGIVIGAVVLAWGLFLLIAGLRSREEDGAR